jgi:hypothetical protein
MPTDIKDGGMNPYQRTIPPISAPISAQLPQQEYAPMYSPAPTEVMEVIKKVIQPDCTFLNADGVCAWIEQGIREPWQSGITQHETAILSTWYREIFKKKYHKAQLRQQVYANVGSRKKTVVDSIYDRATLSF